MKTVRINGVSTEVSQESVVFSDLVSTINTDVSKNMQVISRITVDGRELTETEQKGLAQTPLHDLGEIEIVTANPFDLAQETLDTLDQYADRIIQNITRAAECYKTKNLISADSYFVRSIDGLDLFVQTVGGIKLALRIGLNSKIALTEATLVSVMNDLLDAKRQNNYTFMAELLEKDLIENINEWKTVVFPLFRTLKSS